MSDATFVQPLDGEGTVVAENCKDLSNCKRILNSFEIENGGLLSALLFEYKSKRISPHKG